MEELADSQVGKDFVDPQKPVTADLVAHEKEVQACPMIMAKVKKELWTNFTYYSLLMLFDAPLVETLVTKSPS